MTKAGELNLIIDSTKNFQKLVANTTEFATLANPMFKKMLKEEYKMKKMEIEKIVRLTKEGFNTSQIIKVLEIMTEPKYTFNSPLKLTKPVKIKRNGSWVTSLKHAPTNRATWANIAKIEKMLENDRQITSKDIQIELGVARATANRLFHKAHYKIPNTQIFREHQKKYLVKKVV